MVSDSSFQPPAPLLACRHFVFTEISLRFSPSQRTLLVCVMEAVLLGEDHHLHVRKCAVCRCRASANHLAAAQRRWDIFFGSSCYSLATSFQHGTGNLNWTGTFTSHSPMASWFLSCISQSSWTLSAQWWMVRITGLVSRAPGGPQLTTGLSSVWVSSTGGLDKTENSHFQPQGGQIGCLFFFTIKSELAF